MTGRRNGMLCTLNRWMISRAEDTGKKLSCFAERHVKRCGACREFARSSASLSTELRVEKAAFLDGVPEFSVRALSPTDVPATERGNVTAAERRRGRPWSFLLPLPAAAVAVLLVAIGVFVVFRIGRHEPELSPQDRAAAMAALKSVSSAPGELEGVISEAESSLDKERQILEKSIASAAEYLQARLNIKIERRNPPSKSS
jgi:hypothetical protein